jgi:hypothetical protein
MTYFQSDLRRLLQYQAAPGIYIETNSVITDQCLSQLIV